MQINYLLMNSQNGWEAVANMLHQMFTAIKESWSLFKFDMINTKFIMRHINIVVLLGLVQC